MLAIGMLILAIDAAQAIWASRDVLVLLDLFVGLLWGFNLTSEITHFARNIEKAIVSRL